jgi:hypothetical protein
MPFTSGRAYRLEQGHALDMRGHREHVPEAPAQVSGGSRLA